MGCKTLHFFSPVQTGLLRELAESLTRATQPGLVSPGGSDQLHRATMFFAINPHAFLRGRCNPRTFCSQRFVKSKTARRFVTLGPAAVQPSRAAGAGAGGGPRGRTKKTTLPRAGPATGRDGAHETRLDAWEFAAKSKTARRFVTLGPPRLSDRPGRPARGRGAAPGGPRPPPRHRYRGGGARNGPRRHPQNAFGRVGICG
jgi:hypothetical protein